jgi:CRP-like cAMP-binding protein
MLRALAPELKEKTFKQGTVLQEAGELVEHIYFPQSGMISLIVVTQDGAGIEAATVGREGAVGIHGALGRRLAFTRAVTQITSKCSYLPAERLRKAAESDQGFDRPLHRNDVGGIAADHGLQCEA